MRTLSFAVFLTILSFNSFALENGIYTNRDHGVNDPLMYKSIELDSSSCANGGFIVKFHNADPMNFCLGVKEHSVFKYKKCVGKEVVEYPVRFCVGIKRTVDLINEKEVSQDKESNALVLTERNIDDKKLFFEQEFRLLDAGEGKIKLIHSFNHYADGRSGTNEILFEKTQDK